MSIRIRRRKNSSTNRSPRMLGFQQLESRRLLAANILTTQAFDAGDPVANVVAEVGQNPQAANAQPASACQCPTICGILATGGSPFCRTRQLRLRAAAGHGDGGQSGGSIDPISQPEKFRHSGHQGSTGNSIDPLSDPGRFRNPGHQQPDRGSIDPISNPEEFKARATQPSPNSPPGGLVGPFKKVEPSPGVNPEDGATTKDPVELPAQRDLPGAATPQPVNSTARSIDPLSNPEKFTHRDHHFGLTNPANPTPERDLGQNLPNPDDYFEQLGRESGLQDGDVEEPVELPPPPNFQPEGIPLPEHAAPNPFGSSPDSLLGPRGEVAFDGVRNAFVSMFTTTDLGEAITRLLRIQLLRSRAGLKSPFVTTREN